MRAAPVNPGGFVRPPAPATVLAFAQPVVHLTSNRSRACFSGSRHTQCASSNKAPRLPNFPHHIGDRVSADHRDHDPGPSRQDVCCIICQLPETVCWCYQTKNSSARAGSTRLGQRDWGRCAALEPISRAGDALRPVKRNPGCYGFGLQYGGGYAQQIGNDWTLATWQIRQSTLSSMDLASIGSPTLDPFHARQQHCKGPRHRSGERCAIPCAGSRASACSSWAGGFFL